MHNFPDAVFRSKDARSPQSHGCDLLPSGDFDPEALYLHNEGKLRSYILYYILNAVNSPSLYKDAARSIVTATCFHPQVTGPKGVATLTSSRWENTIL